MVAVEVAEVATRKGLLKTAEVVAPKVAAQPPTPPFITTTIAFDTRHNRAPRTIRKTSEAATTSVVR